MGDDNAQPSTNGSPPAQNNFALARCAVEEAFHQDAGMFGELAGTRDDVPVQELFDMADQRPADTGNYQSRILSITQVGDAATATVAEMGYWGTVSFIDFLSVCRIDGTWKIVNKTFAHVGGEPPA
jgi:hypothetical protein